MKKRQILSFNNNIFLLTLVSLSFFCLIGSCSAKCDDLTNKVIAASEGDSVGTILFNVSANFVNIQPTSNPQNDVVNATNDGNGIWNLILSSALDAETMANSLQIDVECKNTQNEKAVSYTIRLVIEDVNEFPPVFPEKEFEATVNELTKDQTSVFAFNTVNHRAIDKDITGATIIYRIVDGASGYFKMSPNGDVILDKTLDYEKGPRSFLLNISATESIGSGKVTYVPLNITIIDEDDVNPIFGSKSYSLSLPEGDYYGNISFVTSPPLSAEDGDVSVNQAIAFGIDQSTKALYNDLFSINKTGSLVVNGRLDIGTYSVNVKAYQTDKPLLRNAVVVVVVTVTDVNDHSPVMSQQEYTATVSELATIGTTVLTVTAEDKDLGDNAAFQFELLDSSQTFSVTTNDKQGAIILKKTLDRGIRKVYYLQVRAIESKTVEKWTSLISNITITVLDVNNNSPIFQKSDYAFQVKRTDTSGGFVGQVNATDKDGGSNGLITYSLPSPMFSAVTITNDTGVITLTRDLGYSDIGNHTVLVQATDNDMDQSSRRSSVVPVTISVLPVNDQAPRFINPASYDFNVSETTPLGTLIGQISASDADGDPVQYSFKAGNTVDYLRLDSTTGEIFLDKPFDLDSANPPQLSQVFKVEASDGAHVTSADVKVNFLYTNQFAPVFKPTQIAMLFENATQGTEVVKMEATDKDKGPDGELRFSLLDTTSQNIFKIDPKSGEITLNCDRCLNYDIQRRYDVLVKVEDGGRPSLMAVTSVTVRIVETVLQPPKFSQDVYFVTVKENEPKRVILQLEAYDSDTPREQLIFGTTLPADPPGSEALLDVTQKGEVSTHTSIDAETIQSFVVGVSVNDGNSIGYAKVVVNITDVNEFPPELKLKQSPLKVANIPENASLGQTVTTISAEDKDVTNDGFTYWLADGADGKFSIDATTGEISVAGQFDRSQKTDYNITVFVSDHGSPPQMSSGYLEVVITDSNRGPIFIDDQHNPVSDYTFSVPEDLMTGDLVGILYASDPDSGSSGQLSFEIQSQDSGNHFALDKNDGNLTLVSPLNYEKKNLHILNVIVRDSSFNPKSASATVTVNITNVVEAPQWPLPLPIVYLTQSSTCKSQLQAFSREVTTVASRGDETVEYRLRNMTDEFSINTTTGLLQSKKTLVPGNYNVGLKACSGGTDKCSDADLTVVVKADDILSFCPAFYVANISESAVTDTFVYDLNTNKGDKAVLYSIFKGDSDGKFRIDPNDGKLYVVGPLDREKIPRYTLLIEAKQNVSGEIAQAQIIVTLNDEPDSAPQFLNSQYTGEISEADSNGTAVRVKGNSNPLTVTASDADENAHLVYSIDKGTDTSNGSFSVDDKGKILLTQEIDFESIPTSLKNGYTFLVLVSDGIYTSNATVTIHVLDANDNTPVFVDQSTLILDVKEGGQVPRSLWTLNATDRDSVDDRKLDFSLVDISSPGLADSPFRIHHQSGLLELMTQLDRERIDEYTLNATVTDSAGHASSKEIIVKVGDINDNRPVFGNDTYYMNVTEDHGTKISVTPHSIVTGQTQSLLVNCSFSHAPSKVSYLESLVLSWSTDQGSTFTGDGGKGTWIEFEATDDDTGNNSKLHYMIESASVDPDFFTINETTPGQMILKTTKALDREKFDPDNVASSVSINITIQTKDQGNPPLSGSCTVIITIIDINDWPPAFDLGDKMFYSAMVTESDKNNTILNLSPALSVTDKDSEKFGKPSILFSLVKEDDEDPFSVDVHTGQLYLMYQDGINNLDRENKSAYFLQIVATDEYGEGLNSTERIVVNVTDVDDEAPYFPQKAYSFSVQENSPMGTEVGNVTAKDRDEITHVILYEVNGICPFVADPTKGIIKVAGLLDRETISSYILNISACDDGGCGYTTVSVDLTDVNDNCPVWDSVTLTLTIAENQALESVVGHLNATDTDLGSAGEVTYFTNDSKLNSYLRINSSGEVTLLNKNIVTLPMPSTFTVYAMDNESPSCIKEAKLKVDINWMNKFEPEICFRGHCGVGIIKLTVFDDAEPGTVIGQIQAHDNDTGPGGNIFFNLTTDGDGGETMKITDTGIIILEQTMKADMNFTLLVRDGGKEPKSATASVLVTVLTKPLDAVQFNKPSYNLSVPENKDEDAFVGTVLANSGAAGSSLSYAIPLEDDAVPFTVDPSNGTIRTTMKLDREMIPLYQYVVSAVNNNEPQVTALTMITVRVLDVNDNHPVFDQSSLTVTVAENTIKDLATFHAEDADSGINKLITYSLVNEKNYQQFQVNGANGTLFITEELDREMKSVYDLVVQAKDGGNPAQNSTANITVLVSDMNDNKPKFSNSTYYAKIPRPESLPFKIMTIEATDKDEGANKQILFSLDSNSHLFSIDPLNGEIEAIRDLENDSYTLSVVAKDLGNPPQNSTATVIVTVLLNDTEIVPSLLLSNNSETIFVGMEAGTRLKVNILIDKADTVEISAGNEAGLFRLENKESIYLTKKLLKSSVYDLTVTAISTTGYTVNKTLRVSVVSVKFDQPVYLADVKENSNVPHKVLDLDSFAEQLGVPVVYSLSRPSSLFDLNSQTGVLSVIRTLDREEASLHVLNITLTLREKGQRRKRSTDTDPANAQVIVRVVDVNDNPPSFGNLGSELFFNVPADANSSYLITKLQAFDLDEIDNGTIRYSIVQGDKTIFNLDPVTGELRVASPDGLSSNQQFLLTVKATDGYGAEESAVLKIKITVVQDRKQFRLVASIPVSLFKKNQEDIMNNLSKILSYTLHLDNAIVHEDAEGVDAGRSDIVFKAVDPATNLTLNVSQIQQTVSEKQAQITALFDSYQKTKSGSSNDDISVASIALIALAGVMFLASLGAIIIVYRLWKRQKDYAKREERAAKARQKMEENIAMDTIKDTGSNSDSDEPLEMDIDLDDSQLFNPSMFLRHKNESQSSDSENMRPQLQPQIEEQEQTFYFNSELKNDVSTMALRQHIADIDRQRMLQLFNALGEASIDSGIANSVSSGSKQESPTHSPGAQEKKDQAPASSREGISTKSVSKDGTEDVDGSKDLGLQHTSGVNNRQDKVKGEGVQESKIIPTAAVSPLQHVSCKTTGPSDTSSDSTSPSQQTPSSTPLENQTQKSSLPQKEKDNTQSSVVSSSQQLTGGLNNQKVVSNGGPGNLHISELSNPAISHSARQDDDKTAGNTKPVLNKGLQFVNPGFPQLSSNENGTDQLSDNDANSSNNAETVTSSTEDTAGSNNMERNSGVAFVEEVTHM